MDLSGLDLSGANLPGVIGDLHGQVVSVQCVYQIRSETNSNLLFYSD